MQLRKANWRVVRDRIPCTRCCSAEHSTRECGKTKKEIETDRRSRERNPQDPINRANEVSVEPKEYSVAGAVTGRLSMGDDNWRSIRDSRNEAREYLEERRGGEYAI